MLTKATKIDIDKIEEQRKKKKIKNQLQPPL